MVINLDELQSPREGSSLMNGWRDATASLRSTGHGYFRRFLNRIRRDETSRCHHCVDLPEDTVGHTVEVCPTWAEHRRVLQEATGGDGAGGGRGGMGNRHFLLRSSNASEGGGVAETGVDSNFRLPTPLPPEFEWPPSASMRRSSATVGAGLRTASIR